MDLACGPRGSDISMQTTHHWLSLGKTKAFILISTSSGHEEPRGPPLPGAKSPH